MSANSLINTYYGPTASLKWEQNLTVPSWGDGETEEEEKCLPLIQMDSRTSLVGFSYSGIQFDRRDWRGLDPVE